MKPMPIAPLVWRVGLRMKHFRISRWLTDVFSGSDLRRSVGDVVRKYRRIDRANDRYVEHVQTDDGTVLRDVDEALSSHRGHGSAKKSGRTSRTTDMTDH